jgi:phosphate transport system permease protein
MSTPPVTTEPESPPAAGRGGRRVRRRGDVVFRGMSQSAGMLVLVLIVAIAVFLLVQAWPAFRKEGLHFFTEKQWLPDRSPEPPAFGVAVLVFGTILSSVLALVLAVPVAIGTALFITEVAPAAVGRLLGYLIDLLAAVPSVVYGLWGLYFLVPRLVPLQRWMSDHLGFVPIFKSPEGLFGRSMFAASLVLAIMVLPIVAAISREVFRQVPRANREAALALGATRWEAIRMAVLPYGRSGIIGGVMLGLGRALGETIAIALVLSSTFKIDLHIFQPGGNTIAANIATKFGEAGILGRQALIASGLVLFAITLVVNMAARAVVYRTGRITGDAVV